MGNLGRSQSREREAERVGDSVLERGSAREDAKISTREGELKEIRAAAEAGRVKSDSRSLTREGDYSS